MSTVPVRVVAPALGFPSSPKINVRRPARVKRRDLAEYLRDLIDDLGEDGIQEIFIVGTREAFERVHA